MNINLLNKNLLLILAGAALLSGCNPCYADTFENATNEKQEALVLNKCASNSTQKQSYFLLSGIRKKQLDNDFKNKEIEYSQEQTTITKVVGYDSEGRPLTETIVTIKPTQYTEDAYRMRELQYERNSNNILQGVNTLGTFAGLWRLFK